MLKSRILREILRTLAVFFAACLLLWLAREFVFNQYAITSPRPAATLVQGDRIGVLRTSYGLRLPFEKLFNCRRVGYTRPHRGDMMAFNLPTDTARQIPWRDVCVALCYALPGDTVFLNRNYRLSRQGGKASFPFAVPAKGRRVNVTKWNARLICNTVNLHEPCHCAEMIGDTLLIDGHPARYVMFTQDYYWAYSGLASNTNDSRSYGLVPASHLIGKVLWINYSVIPGAPFYACLRPDRFAKTINSKP